MWGRCLKNVFGKKTPPQKAGGLKCTAARMKERMYEKKGNKSAVQIKQFLSGKESVNNKLPEFRRK